MIALALILAAAPVLKLDATALPDAGTAVVVTVKPETLLSDVNAFGWKLRQAGIVEATFSSGQKPDLVMSKTIPQRQMVLRLNEKTTSALLGTMHTEWPRTKPSKLIEESFERKGAAVIVEPTASLTYAQAQAEVKHFTSGGAVFAMEEAVAAVEKKDLREILYSNRFKVRACYREVVAKEPSKKLLKLPVKFVIDGDGDVAKAEAHPDTAMPDSFNACVLAVMKQMKFPVPKADKAVTVTFPYVFEEDQAKE